MQPVLTLYPATARDLDTCDCGHSYNPSVSAPDSENSSGAWMEEKVIVHRLRKI